MWQTRSSGDATPKSGQSTRSVQLIAAVPFNLINVRGRFWPWLQHAVLLFFDLQPQPFEDIVPPINAGGRPL